MVTQNRLDSLVNYLNSIYEAVQRAMQEGDQEEMGRQTMLWTEAKKQYDQLVSQQQVGPGNTEGWTDEDWVNYYNNYVGKASPKDLPTGGTTGGGGGTGGGTTGGGGGGTLPPKDLPIQEPPPPGYESTGGGIPGTRVAATTLAPELDQYLGDLGASAFQALYEQQYGIPEVGRNPYQAWLASKWKVPATEYMLGQSPEFDTVGTRTTGEPLSFSQYLQQRQGPVSRLGGSYLSRLTGMSPEEQRALFAREGMPSYLEEEALYGGLQSRYPTAIAQGLLGQAYAEPTQRAWAISPAGTYEGGSFLNYLRNRFGL